MTNKTESKRRQRTPFGTHRRRLSIPQKLLEDVANHYHWINDTEDRIQRAIDAGYDHVLKKDLGGQDIGDPDVHNQNSNLNSRVSKRLRNFEVYLMRIPIEFYQEDQDLKNREMDAIDEAIKGGGRERVEKSYGPGGRLER